MLFNEGTIGIYTTAFSKKFYKTTVATSTSSEYYPKFPDKIALEQACIEKQKPLFDLESVIDGQISTLLIFKRNDLERMDNCNVEEFKIIILTEKNDGKTI